MRYAKYYNIAHVCRNRTRFGVSRARSTVPLYLSRREFSELTSKLLILRRANFGLPGFFLLFLRYAEDYRRAHGYIHAPASRVCMCMYSSFRIILPFQYAAVSFVDLHALSTQGYTDARYQKNIFWLGRAIQGRLIRSAVDFDARICLS